jgi:ABC-2 type transport system permease protein
VLLALYAHRPHAGGYTTSQAVTYVWLTQAALMTVYIWGWFEIAERIRSGDIVSDFGRPVDFQLYWLSQDLGRALYHAVFRGIPPFLIGALVFRLVLPNSVLPCVLFAVSLTLAVLVSFALRFLVNIATFWLLDYRGVGNLVAVFWTFLSGFAVPLTLFPGVWRTVAEALPFAGLVQTPVDIFVGSMHGRSLVIALALQVFWAMVLLGAGRAVLTVAMRKLVVQGG